MEIKKPIYNTYLAPEVFRDSNNQVTERRLYIADIQTDKATDEE